MAFGVEASVDRERLVALAVGGESAVGELRHGHVEDDVIGGARDGDDERIIAYGWSGGSPCGEVGEGVGPADAEEALFRGLPAVGPAAHPVVGIGKGYGTDAVLPGEGDGSLHGGVGIEVADAAVAVPALDGAEGGCESGLDVDVDATVANHSFKTWEAVEAVGVDAVAGGFGEETGAEGGAVFCEAEEEQRFPEGFVEIVVGDSQHEVRSSLRR